MEKPNKVEKFLSASRMKTLETCSWIYWSKYHLNMPDDSNSGAKRGTVCHLILECLLKKGRKKYYTKIMKNGSIDCYPSIIRLIKKHSKKLSIDNDVDFQMIKDMIFVGINNDFHGEGGKVGSPEVAFEIINENPKYRIKGFIDKHIIYSKESKLKIVDYKTSKQKFKGEELQSNVQAMMYTLASRTLWPEIKERSVEFLFLRFPKQPKQELQFSDDQIKGFEKYLEHINKIIDTFDEKKAVANFAYDTDKNKWLCQAGKTWVCPLKRPFDYYVIKDKSGKVLKSSFRDDLKPEEGEVSEKVNYAGCPRFSNTAATQGKKSEDPFDF